MGLLYHCYEKLGDRELYCLLTGQHLHKVRIDRDSATFEYRDRDLALPFTAFFDYPPKWPEWGRHLHLDWNGVQGAEVRSSYGLWRRVTWFLLDALLAWFQADEHEESLAFVFVTGGWGNGGWRADVRAESGTIGGGAHRDRLVEEIAPFDPFPLDSPAPTWRFEPGLAGAREGRIAATEVEGRLPLADLSVSVEMQLAHVPRFVASDGAIFFFHRVRPHVGPEYAPGMDYGLCLSDFAFYFSEFHCSLLGFPIRLDPNACDRDAIVMEEAPRWLSPPGDDSPRHRPRLHPRLNERLFFATAGAREASISLPSETMPMMRDLEVGQDKRFGHGLGHVSEPPMSVGLPHSYVKFVPGVAHARDASRSGA